MSDANKISCRTVDVAELLSLDWSKQAVDVNEFSGLIEEKRLFSQLKSLTSGNYQDPLSQQTITHVLARNDDAFFDRMTRHCELVRANHKLKHVIHVGIGGSDLGPRLVHDAFVGQEESYYQLHFVSDISGTEFAELSQRLDPEETMVIVVSKSFSSEETRVNAELAMQWLKAAEVPQQLIAVTAQRERALTFGFSDQQIVELDPGIGGRFSIWSEVSLSLALVFGVEFIKRFISGARAVDQQVAAEDPTHNAALLMALQTYQAQGVDKVILPYHLHLQWLPSYLQQLFMESLGKSVAVDGAPMENAAGPVVWGDIGTRSQHGFHQYLLQSGEKFSIDFVLPLDSNTDERLVAHCIAQSRTMFFGETEVDCQQELIADGVDRQKAQLLAKHKAIPGGIKSNTLLLNGLTPSTLGALIALYEYQVIILSWLYGSNAFDQWGVEVGKTMAKQLHADLIQGQCSDTYDVSTAFMMNRYIDLKK